MMVTYYAIRNRSTGYYLPGGARAATKPSEEIPTPAYKRAPRLWDNPRNAHVALTHYSMINGWPRDEFVVDAIEVNIP